MVLLKREKSACGVGMWFESSRSPLYSNSQPSFSLRSLFLVNLSNWGQGWRALAFLQGLCDIFMATMFDFSLSVFSLLCWHPEERRGGEGFDVVSASNLTVSTLRGFLSAAVFHKSCSMSMCWKSSKR